MWNGVKEDKLKRILLIFVIMLLLFSCYKVEADSFTSEFYSSVNIMRESMNLHVLTKDYRVERVAETYSNIIAKEGKINHFALTDFEFNSLCTNYDIQNAKLFEVLASCPDFYSPYQIFLLFMDSDSHREALLNASGQFLGAGYTKNNGKIFFTAYVMVEKE